MDNQPSLAKIVGEVLRKGQSEQEKAVALHNFVRDGVLFGFSRNFDAATPEETLSCGRGHGIPKSRLLAALFKTAGFESYLHFVLIPKEILWDTLPPNLYWLLPDEISHSYVEVKVSGWWCRIDSFIVDRSLQLAGRARLRIEKRQMGYGVRLGGTSIWSGRGDAFSQFSEVLMVADHGRVEDPVAFFKDSRYRNKIYGIPVNTLFRFRGKRNTEKINADMDRFRRLGWVERVV